MAARNTLINLPSGDIGCISAITEGEIRYGLAKMPHAHKLRSAMEGFLMRIKVLSWGQKEALNYGELRAAMESQGKTLENMDMLIAAHAVSVGATLVTNDKAFRHVRGLAGIVKWAIEIQAALK
jgi:tRNA(fMet)-specific endonuclease VapC